MRRRTPHFKIVIDFIIRYAGRYVSLPGLFEKPGRCLKIIQDISGLYKHQDMSWEYSTVTYVPTLAQVLSFSSVAQPR